MASYDKEVDFELIKSLECDICKNFFVIPIMECRYCGKTACEKCAEGKDHTCSGQKQKLDARNFRLESIAQKALYPCVMGTKGCSVILTYEQKSSHIEECLFKTRECPYSRFLQSSCIWKGILTEMKSHALQEHGIETDTRQDSGPFKVYLTDIKEPKQYCSAVVKFQELFFIVWELKEGKVVCSVTLVGTKENALNYKFKFDISDGVKRLKFSFADVCCLLGKSGKSLKFVYEMVHNFGIGNTLEFKMEIHKPTVAITQKEIPKEEILRIVPKSLINTPKSAVPISEGDSTLPRVNLMRPARGQFLA